MSAANQLPASMTVAEFLAWSPPDGSEDRMWPALSRYKRTRRKTDDWRRHRSSVAGVKTTCSIEKAALLSVLRRWCPISRLEAWHMAVCDHAQRPSRYDPLVNR